MCYNTVHFLKGVSKYLFESMVVEPYFRSYYIGFLFYIEITLLLVSMYDVMFNKRVGVFYHNIKHDA
jgi:hypothetical protein